MEDRERGGGGGQLNSKYMEINASFAKSGGERKPGAQGWGGSNKKLQGLQSTSTSHWYSVKYSRVTVTLNDSVPRVLRAEMTEYPSQYLEYFDLN